MFIPNPAYAVALRIIYIHLIISLFLNVNVFMVNDNNIFIK